MTERNSSRCDDTFKSQLLPYIYGVELCLALVGNVFALWLLVTKERRNWHTGVVFSCNLAISDILYALTLPLLIIHYARRKGWPFPEAVCKIERFLFSCNLYASIYFIMCISVNRYLAIVHPFFTRKHVNPKHAKIASLLVWMVVAIISSPILSFAGLRKVRCRSFSNRDEVPKYSYRIFMAISGCLVPFVVTFASYFGVIWVVLKNANITTLEKRKVALIVSLVCVLYAISFVPYHILQIWHFHLKDKKITNCTVDIAYQVSKGLASLNMCLHPILYTAVFDSIRTAVCCKRRSNESPMSLQ
ncbi:P2Y purinoceptor 11 [Astyanax mexicanus]|uniref:Purinergic receptor P2Y11 n=2 Tax=Astyanax mexicanus TaxID=7994 RepID=W5LTC3_ASTMX|nr:P2Y purinoceptor 11 [Astyanax mexicanus]KAG9278981.1 P2Y purinoceptor 11 [Astyanax mexicanus]